VSPSPDRFTVLARRLGAGTDPAPLAVDLLHRWAEPARTYHSLRHLDDCLAQLDAAPADPTNRDLVEAALWFHDAVYDPRQGDNEGRSAEMAREGLTNLGVAAASCEAIARLVLLTRYGEQPTDREGRLVCDIDLSILGRAAAEFDRYDREIRAEYGWVPETNYRRERAAVLRGFLAREPLYLTPHFRARYEQPARMNLSRAISRLEADPKG
jgi:predicted metal-dependent HD superfamily phosphohydrolase